MSNTLPDWEQVLQKWRDDADKLPPYYEDVTILARRMFAAGMRYAGGFDPESYCRDTDAAWGHEPDSEILKKADKIEHGE